MMNLEEPDKEIRLFVDDERDPQDYGLDGWIVARTSVDAIRTLKNRNVVECTLDHDLGGKDSGYLVVLWMEAHNRWPRDGVRCHSMNPVGRTRILAAIEAAERR